MIVCCWATFSQWQFQILKGEAQILLQSQLSFLHCSYRNMEQAASLLFAISFGEFSLNLQTMFKHNFSLQSSVICPDKIRNHLFLAAVTSVNLSSRVGKMFVCKDLIACLLWSFLVSFLLTSTHSELCHPSSVLQLSFMWWWIPHLCL